MRLVKQPFLASEADMLGPLLKKRKAAAKVETTEEKLQKFHKHLAFRRKIIQTDTENWLAKHGKTQYIQFNKAKKDDLRRCFLSIDMNGSKSIELEEIIEAMLTLGIAESKLQAKQLFKEVDLDDNGHIEFSEFLFMLRNKNPKVRALTDLFNNVIERKIDIDTDMLPFQVVVSNYRRKMIMNAVMEPGNPNEELILKSTSQVFTRKFKKLKMNIQKNCKTRFSLKNLIVSKKK